MPRVTCPPKEGLGGLQIRVSGMLLDPRSVLRAEVFLAADRPSRLEVSLVAPSRGVGPWMTVDPGGGDGLVPGALVLAAFGGRNVFEGAIARSYAHVDPETGPCLALVSVSAYHGLRASIRGRVFHQITDSELAEAIADGLGLVAVTDATPGVHPRIVIDADPLSFLRNRARACHRHLAVIGGTLHFTADPPRSPEPPMRVMSRELRSLRIGASDGPVGRQGRLELTGDARWRPACELVLAGLGPRMDGSYRVLRVLHGLDRRGYGTTVEFLERGMDPGPSLDGERGGKVESREL